MYEESNDLVSMLEELYETLYYGLGIAELGAAGVFLMLALITAVVTAVVSFVTTLIIWIVEAYPTYKLAKKVGYQNAYLAWIPILGNLFRLYVLVAMAGNKPFELFNGKIKIQSRTLSFWIYVAINYFGSAILTAAIGIISIVPVIGQIIGTVSAVLYLIPPFAVGMMEYVYLKDVLDIFKPDKNANNTAAIIVTVLDALATFGLARAIYLCTLLKEEPIPQRFYTARY